MNASVPIYDNVTPVLFDITDHWSGERSRTIVSPLFASVIDVYVEPSCTTEPVAVTVIWFPTTILLTVVLFAVKNAPPTYKAPLITLTDLAYALR